MMPILYPTFQPMPECCLGLGAWTALFAEKLQMELSIVQRLAKQKHIQLLRWNEGH